MELRTGEYTAGYLADYILDDFCTDMVGCRIIHNVGQNSEAWVNSVDWGVGFQKSLSKQ